MQSTPSEVTCARKKRELPKLTLSHLAESHISVRKCWSGRKENKRQQKSSYKPGDLREVK